MIPFILSSKTAKLIYSVKSQTNGYSVGMEVENHDWCWKCLVLALGAGYTDVFILCTDYDLCSFRYVCHGIKIDILKSTSCFQLI